LGVETSLIKRTKEKKTNTSVIFIHPGQDNTALVYRGASDTCRKEDMPWEEIKNTKWFYLAPFSGDLALLTEELVSFAKDNGIKVAINPGYSQLKMPKSKIGRILSMADVLIINREEAALITGASYDDERGIFKKLDAITKGICVMTKGADGAIVSDGEFLYEAKSFKGKYADSTGAGDAFGSGFVSGLMEAGDIVYGIQFGIANAVSNIREFGAKEGLLLKGQDFKKIKVVKKSCNENQICLKKC
jgi:ribokinase